MYAYPTWDSLYKQLGNLRILHRESALHAARRSDAPVMDVLRKAHILAFIPKMAKGRLPTEPYKLQALPPSIAPQDDAVLCESLAGLFA